MPITLNIDKKQPLEYSHLDEETKRLAENIYNLSKGVTVKQFTDAIEFALEKTANYLILRDE